MWISYVNQLYDDFVDEIVRLMFYHEESEVTSY